MSGENLLPPEYVTPEEVAEILRVLGEDEEEQDGGAGSDRVDGPKTT